MAFALARSALFAATLAACGSSSPEGSTGAPASAGVSTGVTSGTSTGGRTSSTSSGTSSRLAAGSTSGAHASSGSTSASSTSTTTTGAATDRVVVNLAGPTGNVALPTAFGVAVNPGNDAFGTMLSSTALRATTWQAQIAAIGGVGLIRANFGNTYGYSTLAAMWPSRASFTGNSPDWSQFDSFWMALQQMGFSGRVIICMGQPASWLDVTTATPGTVTSDQAIFGQMAVQLAQRMTSNGYTNSNIYFEGINEPDQNGVAAVDAANLVVAMQQAFAGAGLNCPVGGPVIANAYGNISYVTQLGETMPTGLGFLSYHLYSDGDPLNSLGGQYSPGDAQNRIQQAIDPVIGYGGQTNAVRDQAPGDLPVFIGEYNMYGLPAAEVDQQTNVGAVFNTLAILDGIKNGNLEMGAIWAGFEDFPTSETYGIINGATEQAIGGNFAPGFIYPVGYALGRLYQKMPGNVVATTITPSTLNLYALATVSGSSFGVALVNYDPSATYTVDVAISSAPTSATYYEVSAANAQGLEKSLTASDLAALVLPPMSVVILSP